MRTLLSICCLLLCACTRTAPPPPSPEPALTPPVIAPVETLIPNVRFGQTLLLSAAPYQFRFVSNVASTFGLTPEGIFVGDEQVAKARVDTFENLLTVTVDRPLPEGSYALRFAVAREVAPEQLVAFAPGAADTWELRFFVGATFCPTQAVVCPADDRRSVEVAVQFSGPAGLTSLFDDSLSVWLDDVKATCVPATLDAPLEGSTMNLRCTSESFRSARVTFGAGLRTSDGQLLTACDPQQSLELNLAPAGQCHRYRWVQ